MSNSDMEQRVRERAYNIWLEEGRPEGRDEVHWEMAKKIVATEHDKPVAGSSVEESGK